MLMPKQDVVVPAAHLEERFLSPGSRLAGELTRKVLTYRPKLPVVGDTSSYPMALI